MLLDLLSFSCYTVFRSETMPATFADISWSSSVTSAIAQIRSKGFTILDQDSYEGSTIVHAEGKVFGKVSKIQLDFHQMSLYEVKVYIDVMGANPSFENDRMFCILLQKYGPPSLKETKGAFWDNEATDGIQICFSGATPSREWIGVIYNAFELSSQSEIS